MIFNFTILIVVDAPPDPPTKAQLQGLLAHSAVPFIGFGFLDNLIMIIAVCILHNNIIVPPILLINIIVDRNLLIINVWLQS